MHPQLQRRIVSKYISKPALVVSFLLLVSCASNPPFTSTPVDVHDVAVEQDIENIGDQATPLEERDINMERAEHYQRLASSGDLENQIDAVLSAAEYYIQADDFLSAEQTIQDLAGRLLEPIQQDRYDIIVAYVTYAKDDYVGALNQLKGILNFGNEIQLNTQQIDALLLSSFCYQALGDYGSTVEVLLKREAGLQGQAKAETTRYIWQVVNSIPIQSRQLIIESTSNALVRNRLEQSLNGQFGQVNKQPPQFTQWREEEPLDTKQAINGDWNTSSPQTIAILLPLSSKFDKAAQALLDGIKHQDTENDSIYRPKLIVYDIGENPYMTPQYYAAAIQSGADMVIGPLGKDYANQISSYYGSNIPTILLGGDQPLGDGITRLTMSPEIEGRTVAAKALSDGHLTAAILAPNTASNQRTVDAFSNYWLQYGGKISKTISYSPQQFDHSVELKQLLDINQSEFRYRQLSKTLGFKPKFAAYRRSDVDFIFMVANNKTGRIVRPQINFFSGTKTPVYSTSAVFNGIQDTINNMDLEGIKFPVMPWSLKSTNVAQYAGQLNALFAMGCDAYRIAGNYRKLHSPEVVLNGDTGQLSIDKNREIIHQPIWASFVNGEAVPIQTLGIDVTPLINQQNPLEHRNAINKKGVYDDSNWDARGSRRKTGS